MATSKIHIFLTDLTIENVLLVSLYELVAWSNCGGEVCRPPEGLRCDFTTFIVALMISPNIFEVGTPL